MLIWHHPALRKGGSICLTLLDDIFEEKFSWWSSIWRIQLRICWTLQWSIGHHQRYAPLVLNLFCLHIAQQRPLESSPAIVTLLRERFCFILWPSLVSSKPLSRPQKVQIQIQIQIQVREVGEAGEEEGAKTVGWVEKGRCPRTEGDLLCYNSLHGNLAENCSDAWFPRTGRLQSTKSGAVKWANHPSRIGKHTNVNTSTNTNTNAYEYTNIVGQLAGSTPSDPCHYYLCCTKK